MQIRVSTIRNRVLRRAAIVISLPFALALVALFGATATLKAMAANIGSAWQMFRQ